MKRIISLTALLCSAHTFAADVLIDDITIYDGNTAPYQADVLIKDGIIVDIDKNIVSDAERIDGRGKSLTAGLFSGDTHIGAEEVSAIHDTVDYSSENGDYTASFNVADALNPDSVAVPHNRSLGLTWALVLPNNEKHIFSGRAALVQMSADTMVVNDNVAQVVRLGTHGKDVAGGSRATSLAILRTALEEAKEYANNKKAILRGEYRQLSLSHHDLEALQPVVNGAQQLIIEVDRAADIMRVLQLGQSFNLKLILLSAREGWRVADAIAKANVPVIIDPINNLPMSYDSLGARLDAAALLDKAGVVLVFSGMGTNTTHNAYLVRQAAANAVSNGLSEKAAIKAMTQNPAKIFNVKNHGIIAKGQYADLVVWDGHPLEVMSLPEHVFVNGEEVSLVSRASRLATRYLQRIRESQ
jgi:imidazolonepropionase-like amidohydrolase